MDLCCYLALIFIYPKYFRNAKVISDATQDTAKNGCQGVNIDEKNLTLLEMWGVFTLHGF